MTGVARIGIVGCGYGAQVLAPAFRADPRVELVAIAARNQETVEATAQKLGIAEAFTDWHCLLEPRSIDAIAIAVPPAAQAEVAIAALTCGVPVFAEKSLTTDLTEAERLARLAAETGRANMVDFNFREISAFRAARRVLTAGDLGDMRQVSLSWHVESYANRAGIENWKTDQGSGGGALNNFVSHSLDYLEWLLGPVSGLSARLAGMPHDMRHNDTSVVMALQFASGAAGSVTMSAAAYRGSGHRIEFYGADGSMVLENRSADYMRGFTLNLARRTDPEFSPVEVDAAAEDVWEDGRVLPASRLVGRFLDWVTGGPPAEPSFAAGFRVQQLIDAAQRSHSAGRWVEPRLAEAN